MEICAENEQGAILENEQEWTDKYEVNSDIETIGDENVNHRYKQLDNSYVSRETDVLRSTQGLQHQQSGDYTTTYLNQNTPLNMSSAN
jgi:hypothetical protein